MISFKECSVNITEVEYRNDGRLHYSLLRAFDKGGFHAISTLHDRKESPSLTFGSIVDSMMTGGMEEFNNRFIVNTVIPKDSIAKTVKAAFDLCGDQHDSLYDIDDDVLDSVTVQMQFQQNWKKPTRLNVIREQGDTYYRLMFAAKDKQIISQEMFDKAIACVNALKSSPATANFFAADMPFENIERCYQLIFQETIDGLDYSCMADLIVIDHKNKRVIPCDLKTSSHYEDEFYKSFIEWGYHIQARLYSSLIRKAMDRHPVFREYSLENYRFIVINKESLVPLVWVYEDTFAPGTLYYGKDKNIECRHPFDLAKELMQYIREEPKVKFGINEVKSNSLLEYLNNM